MRSAIGPVSLTLALAACSGERAPPALAEGASGPGPGTTARGPVMVAPPGADAAEGVRAPASAATAGDGGLAQVEPLRPGPGDVDRALLLRLRRELGLPLEVSRSVRMGDAWLVAYTWDENDAWWREVHRSGRTAEVRAALRARRLQCESVFRQPEELEATADAELDPGFDLDMNPMDERSCWERALGSLAPREGPLEGTCLALGVARATEAAIEPLWSETGACVDASFQFGLVDLAGAGWTQLVVQFGDEQWGDTRLGFRRAETSHYLVILDPRGGREPEMLSQVLATETLIDQGFVWHGKYAHVAFKPGAHVTVFEQEWTTSIEACETSPAGWAIEDLGEDEGELAPCAATMTVTRTPWSALTQRWSGEPTVLPPPERPPRRNPDPAGLDEALMVP